MKINNKADLIKVFQKHQHELERIGIKKLGLFGSFVRNEMNDNSDVDVFVDFHSGKKTYDNLFELHELLEKITGRKVEVVTPKALSPFIGPHILKTVEYINFQS